MMTGNVMKDQISRLFVVIDFTDGVFNQQGRLGITGKGENRTSFLGDYRKGEMYDPQPDNKTADNTPSLLHDIELAHSLH